MKIKWDEVIAAFPMIVLVVGTVGIFIGKLIISWPWDPLVAGIIIFVAWLLIGGIYLHAKND